MESGARNCLLLLWLVANIAFGQSSYEPPRNEFGQPDLQGYWINQVRAPFERPEELGLKQAYTAEEAADIISGREAAQQQRIQPSDPNRGAPPAGEIITNVADANFHPEFASNLPLIDGEYRTSLIIDPPNGRIAANPEFRDYYLRYFDVGHDAFDDAKLRPANERCLNSPGQVPLVIQIGPEDSKTMQILQFENYVVLNAEYATAVRIVPLATADNAISWPQWRGTSVGRFEDNSLIVTTRNFRIEQSNRRIRTSSELEVTEVFSRVDKDQLLYRFTFSDPVALEQPFTGEIPLDRMGQGEIIYESACHEGNHAVRGILAGARRGDVDAELGGGPAGTP
ncbi:MAG: hypothetical protein MI746_15195 [Pseudomonadales bacterium]|nr:hypothetical protein [Pseudomonadales bacterium]